ncbi:hypothetical protein PI124_g20597 [Phytophthora idaei]|nr:hypothetical protein PI125_g22032 [Phytophthora idaei]KAG3129690.1 hypothetical protein PI126_g20850 [Phytophthora idaei]KAG3234346.1 hypothetical protein PI124_g20597 [Phytophthora idaei]
MAVPDLPTELLAMAGATVARWALHGTHMAHVVGDVLLSNTTIEVSGIEPTVNFTPNLLAAVPRKIRRCKTMWRTGQLVVTVSHGPVDVAVRAPYVQVLYQLAHCFGMLTFHWAQHGRTLLVDGERLMATTWRAVVQEEVRLDGPLCSG